MDEDKQKEKNKHIYTNTNIKQTGQIASNRCLKIDSN